MKHITDIKRLDFSYSSYQHKIETMDSDSVLIHNQKFDIKSPYHLRANLRPCPFEGNLKTASVILLLANPHADPTTVPSDHRSLDGWGIWGLSGKASKGMQGWWRPRLRQFVLNESYEFEWQSISHKFASFQAVSWASEQFHEVNSLPSKQLMRETLHYIANEYPQKIFVVMRQRKYWNSVLETCNAKHVIYTRSSRCSFVSKGNIDNEANWQLLRNTICGDTVV